MTYKEIAQQISNLNAIQGLIDIYQQVAAMRMRKIKGTVTRNREFYTELLNVYIQAQKAYMMSRKEGTNQNLEANGNATKNRSLTIVLTANTGLYGEIIKSVFDLFINDNLAKIKNRQLDIAIAGRLGRNWMIDIDNSIPFKFFELGDGTNNLTYQLKEIFDYASNYKEVLIYHGVFKNIVEQTPIITRISKDVKQIDKSKGAIEDEGYIFEPSLDQVITTFEERFRHTFFDQSVYESALAKFGSRMVSLDTAVQNINKELSKSTLKSMKIRHREINKKQLNNLLGISVWNKL